MAFALSPKQRELIAGQVEILKKLAQMDAKLRKHDDILTRTDCLAALTCKLGPIWCNKGLIVGPMSLLPTLGPALRQYVQHVGALDTRSLGLYRIALGLIFAAGILQRWTMFDLVYSWDGFISRHILETFEGGEFAWSLFFVVPSDWFSHLLFGVILLCALFFAAGWNWRLSGFVLWLLQISLHYRNPMLENRGDELLVHLLLWGLFLPLGERFVLPVRPLSSSGRAHTQPRTVYGFATMAVILQFIYLYFVGALHKSGHSWRVDYDAVWRALQLSEFSTPLGTWIGQHPEFCQWLTITVFWAEIIVPLLLLLPVLNSCWRMVAIGFSLALQLGLGTTMSLGLFPWASCALVLPLIPWQAWRALANPRLKVLLLQQPGENPDRCQPLWLDRACAFFVVFALASNLESLPNNASKLSRVAMCLPHHAAEAWRQAGSGLAVLGRAARLHQRWSMFSPDPLVEDGWVRIEGRTVTGEWIRLYPELLWSGKTHPVLSGRPATPIAGHPTPRWRKFFERVRHHKSPRMGEQFLERVMKRWNQSAPPEAQLEFLRLIWMYRHVPSRQAVGTEKPRTLAEFPVEAANPPPKGVD